MVCMLPATTTCLLLLLIQGSKALTLTSIPVAEGDSITACPGTTVVVTCLATQVHVLRWTHPISRFFVLKDYGTNFATTVIDPYTISLVNASARNGNLADLVSVLEVMINDIDNGTTVTCQTPPDISKSLTIYKEGPPSPPSNFKIMNYTYIPENLSILLSWEPQDAANIVSYRISINTTTPQEVFTNLTNITLEGEYNTLLEIGLFAMNCAGNSSKVKLSIYQESGISTNDNQPPTDGKGDHYVPGSGNGSTAVTHESSNYVTTSPMDTSGDCTSASSSLSTGDAVAITAVVTGLCSLMAGLLLGVLLTRCVHCHQKTDQTQKPPVYEDILADRKTDIELKHNEAYGHIHT